MLFWVIVKVGLKSLWANKLRSLLAMLGIIIGVGAVIAMLAMGAGAKGQVMSRLSAMGSNLLIIRPGQARGMGVIVGANQRLTLEDALALREVEGVNRLAPVVSGTQQIKYMSRNTRPSITATSTTYLPIRDFHVEKGRPFTEGEVESSARVVILGPVTATNLFDQDDPIGETVKIKGINFTVIGVTKAKGDQGFFNLDDQAFIPYTVGMKQVLGQDYLREINVQAHEGADLTKLQEDMAVILRKRHRIQEGQPNDFDIRNQADLIESVAEVSNTFTILLGSVAGISLLVGGIGIMNIMLVSVTERTREIGIRKAIGARRRSIMTQFLVEAIIISCLGGLMGVGFGVAGARVIGSATNFVTQIELSSILLSLSFSAMVGIFFGWYPARRAAALSPIEALRYE